MVHGSQVERKEQRNKETEQCDVVGAPDAIRCKRLRQSVRMAGFGADNQPISVLTENEALCVWRLSIYSAPDNIAGTKLHLTLHANSSLFS
jgi:hypothetical protein